MPTSGAILSWPGGYGNSDMATVRYTFTLDAIQDADVVRWLALQPNVSAAVRTALKAYVTRPTHADLGNKLDEMLSAIRGIRVVAAHDLPKEDGGEPARAATGLDRMLGKFKVG